ncbi:MAG: hypothetical protein EOP85_03560 [Verrucomicrobiaceae bacterium]|nr:MAG: hypothetical protein EOP85_03560 [Verrucomicrobiaceae bacterium]
MAIAALPADSKLSAISLDAGLLAPSFSPEVNSYSVRVGSDADFVAFTPVARESSAKVTVDGESVLSGNQSQRIPLGAGHTIVEIAVSVENVSSIYTVDVFRPSDLDVEFQSVADQPLEVSSYETAGTGVSFSLNFAPPVGTNLMVINQTGLGFFSGPFNNLAQGQSVDLVHQGKNYRFVANYYGGSGNDLVLEWANRSIASWGHNSVRQLGAGISGNQYVPVMIPRTGFLEGKCPVSVGIGAEYGMALCADGSVAHWGNHSGSVVPARMGDGSPMKRVVAISAANSQSMMLCEDGTTLVGHGGFYSVSPTTRGVLEGKTVVAISKGGFHMLALCSDGTIAGWGQNGSGQLGNGRTSQNAVTTPVAVVTQGALAGKSVVSVTTGISHSMALCSDGTLVSWGANNHGQLGNGSTTFSSVPVNISGMGVLAGKRVVGLSQGAEHFSVVICSDGSVVTWGRYPDGQLGRLDYASSNKPGQVASDGVLLGKRVVSIASGFMHNVAVCSDGTVATWGSNNMGQLGNNSKIRSNVPVEVYGNGELYGKKALSAAAGTHTHVILAEPDSGYAAWASGHQGVSDKRQFSDPDQDGIPNLIEYVLGGSPGSSSTAILPVMSGERDFLFDFTRLASSSEDVSQYFQYSVNMVEWHDVEISPVTDSRVTLGAADGQGRQAVRVTVPKVPGEKMFGRLKVRQP